MGAVLFTFLRLFVRPTGIVKVQEKFDCCGYKQFRREFLRQNRNRGIKNLTRHATRQWRRMSLGERRVYERRATERSLIGARSSERPQRSPPTQRTLTAPEGLRARPNTPIQPNPPIQPNTPIQPDSVEPDVEDEEVVEPDYSSDENSSTDQDEHDDSDDLHGAGVAVEMIA